MAVDASKSLINWRLAELTINQFKFMTLVSMVINLLTLLTNIYLIIVIEKFEAAHLVIEVCCMIDLELVIVIC